MCIYNYGCFLFLSTTCHFQLAHFKTSHDSSNIKRQTEVSTAAVVLRGVGKTSPVHRYSVDIFLYSGLSEVFGYDGKQNTT